MSKNIRDINFDDIDISGCEEDIKEINEDFKNLYKDPKIKKLIKKNKRLSKLYKITNFFELVINYGLWDVITGKVKRTRFDLDYFNEENKNE